MGISQIYYLERLRCIWLVKKYEINFVYYMCFVRVS